MPHKAVNWEATEADTGTEGSLDEKQQTVVDVSQFIEHHNSETAVLSFAVEEHQRNTEANPDRENTHILPVLVRRVSSQELLPGPFQSTNQLLCASYLSALCCLCIGVFAVHCAWEAKEKRNSGMLSSAASYANQSYCSMKWAVVVGVIFLLAGTVFVVLEFCTDLL
ncbi:uncharacterized protein LOC143283419 [Babylonia areolata]|uniref:uncharacterized protein LOC143283419 n=1 Tax=Babylonia areolata TaxID=304850 RepID=UPI003FD50749